MKIGDIIVLIESHKMLGWPYQRGQRFKIIGDDAFRGWDIESLDTGQKIYEIRFSAQYFITLQEYLRIDRDLKLNDIGI